jgi:hypothetical protein
VPDPDSLSPEAPEVIEFTSASQPPPASGVRNRLLIAGAAAAVVVVVAVAAVAGNWFGGTHGAGASGGNPALTRLIAQVTSVPVSTSDAVGGGHGQLMVYLAPVTGARLTANGKPEVFYDGTEFCPYCATQNWALIVALSRFGTFEGLSTIRSDKYPPYSPLDTWTFYGSAFTSKYLAFVPVETKSNVATSPGHYRKLQQLTAAQQALVSKYDKPGSTPFLDFGNKYVIIGSLFSPAALGGQTWNQIATALRNPRSATAQAILGAANYITQTICRLTGDQPASACTPAVMKLPAPRIIAFPGS